MALEGLVNEGVQPAAPPNPALLLDDRNAHDSILSPARCVRSLALIRVTELDGVATFGRPVASRADRRRRRMLECHGDGHAEEIGESAQRQIRSDHQPVEGLVAGGVESTQQLGVGEHAGEGPWTSAGVRRHRTAGEESRSYDGECNSQADHAQSASLRPTSDGACTAPAPASTGGSARHVDDVITVRARGAVATHGPTSSIVGYRTPVPLPESLRANGLETRVVRSPPSSPSRFRIRDGAGARIRDLKQAMKIRPNSVDALGAVG